MSLPKKYPTLATTTLKAHSPYMQPSATERVLHRDDPAVYGMIDFKQALPLTLDPEASIVDAEQMMKNEHSTIVLITDHHQHILGLLTSEDLFSEKPLKIASERKLRRTEIPVGLMMTARDHIVAFYLKDIKNAKVGQVIETLHQMRQHYGFVIDQNTLDQHTLRGIFSLHQISKQLGHDVTFDLSEAHSLAELQQERKGK